MEVRIVKKQKNINKKPFVVFTEGDSLEIKKKFSQYKENDVVFVEKDNSGNFQIRENQGYSKLIKELEKLEKLNKCEISKLPSINKSPLINKFTNIFNLDKEYSSNRNEEEILEQVEKNNELIKKELGNRFDCLEFQAVLNDKLIIGLGNQSVFETGITVHHTYGVPYIPGSALKGILRNFIIQEYFDECTDESDCEESANKDSLFVKIFGGKNDKGESVKGNIVFMDSFPNANYKMKRDIMTPHHKEYYSSKENQNSSISGADNPNFKKTGHKDSSILPLDNDDTNPIQFLVVEKKSAEKLKFEINLAIDRNISSEIIQKKEIVNNKIKEKYENKNVYDFILENLIDALNFFGIGAKTSAGYGYFDIDKEKVKKKREKQLKDMEEKRKKIEEEEREEEVTKNMTPLEIEFHKIKGIKTEEEKNQAIFKLFNSKIDDLEDEEQKKLAEYIKAYLMTKNKWKYKTGKKGKTDKNANRIKKICNILGLEKPT